MRSIMSVRQVEMSRNQFSCDTPITFGSLIVCISITSASDESIHNLNLHFYDYGIAATNNFYFVRGRERKKIRHILYWCLVHEASSVSFWLSSSGEIL